ncbi:translation initiation factor 2 [Streptomyces sp. NPDC060194]|uniref:translation initiation factor 2 n=1 Tax=Streptomyces sp. NPDC060194 TaxID=3347069 RepID=UPI00364E39A5
MALYRLLDTLPVFAGDPRIRRFFTLVPGSDFGVDVLAAIDAAGARSLPWDEACRRTFDLILTASPKGELRLLRGDRVLLPHGAGFGKTVPSEGGDGLPSGLSPAHLPADDSALALYALAHPDQVAALAKQGAELASRARVVGDPTLDRLLASRPLRERYREALGTGGRRLIVLTSTWGPHSLLRQRPDLAAELLARLPYDGYQCALVVHPNERSLLSDHDLRELLAPAVDAGLLLPAAYEGWAATLVAADALVTDHGSTALYFAALDERRPVVVATDGGAEVVPDSPVATLLSGAPRLRRDCRLPDALAEFRPGPTGDAARSAFAERGDALGLLRAELYDLLALDPPHHPAVARTLPPPAPAVRTAAAFDVHTRVDGPHVTVDRIPAGLGPAGRHLAAEYGLAGEGFVRTAAVLHRRAAPPPPGPYARTWTAADWTAHALDTYAACRLAAVVLPDGRCLARLRGDDRLWTIHVDPADEGGRRVRVDPAAALSGLHAWRSAHHRPPAGELTCTVGGRDHPVRVAPATARDGDLPV